MFKDWGACVDKGTATFKCIPTLFQNIVTALIFFVGTVALFLIIFNGMKLIASRGDAKQLEAARSSLYYVIIGLVLVLLSFFIINIISYVTGVDCIKFFGFDNCK